MRVKMSHVCFCSTSLCTTYFIVSRLYFPFIVSTETQARGGQGVSVLFTKLPRVPRKWPTPYHTIRKCLLNRKCCDRRLGLNCSHLLLSIHARTHVIKPGFSCCHSAAPTRQEARPAQPQRPAASAVGRNRPQTHGLKEMCCTAPTAGGAVCYTAEPPVQLLSGNAAASPGAGAGGEAQQRTPRRLSQAAVQAAFQQSPGSLKIHTK